jgi:hypothetical protein
MKRLCIATLKVGARPADQRNVDTLSRPLLPLAAFAAIAICLLAALTPARAAAGDNNNGSTAPKATTGAATLITATTATLNGVVLTNGADTKYFFQYGPTTGYGATTPTQVIPAGHGGPVSVPATNLVPATVYHFRVVAVHTGFPWNFDIGADAAFTTAPAPVAPVAPVPAAVSPASLPAAPTATLGTSVVVAPVSGTVFVKVPGTAAYAPLGAGSAVPVGAVLDTRRGKVALTSALDGGKTQTATFERGVFQVRQSAKGHGLTDIYLRGPAPSCGTSRSSGRAAAVAKRKPPKKRQLWGRDKGGRFRTHGSNSVATVRGTSWITTDTCSGTRTTVKAGAVSVRDVHRHRTVLVRAGHSYLARRR